MRESPKEFYAIEYELNGESKWATFFNLECAQEAMMKMIKRGTNVKGLETRTFNDEVQ